MSSHPALSLDLLVPSVRQPGPVMLLLTSRCAPGAADGAAACPVKPGTPGERQRVSLAPCPPGPGARSHASMSGQRSPPGQPLVSLLLCRKHDGANSPNQKPPAGRGGLGKGRAKGLDSRVWFQIRTVVGWIPARPWEAVAVVAGRHQTLTSCPPPDGAG